MKNSLLALTCILCQAHVPLCFDHWLLLQHSDCYSLSAAVTLRQTRCFHNRPHGTTRFLVGGLNHSRELAHLQAAGHRVPAARSRAAGRSLGRDRWPNQLPAGKPKRSRYALVLVHHYSECTADNSSGLSQTEVTEHIMLLI